MATKLNQPVSAKVTFADGTEITGPPITGTNDRNLQGKITAWLRRILIGYSFHNGGTITVTIGPVEPDEFARPDPE